MNYLIALLLLIGSVTNANIPGNNEAPKPSIEIIEEPCEILNEKEVSLGLCLEGNLNLNGLDTLIGIDSVTIAYEEGFSTTVNLNLKGSGKIISDTYQKQYDAKHSTVFKLNYQKFIGLKHFKTTESRKEISYFFQIENFLKDKESCIWKSGEKVHNFDKKVVKMVFPKRSKEKSVSLYIKYNDGKRCHIYGMNFEYNKKKLYYSSQHYNDTSC